jgi:hypothetical protein
VTTRSACRILGATLWQLVYLIRTNRLPPPPKIEGRLVWGPEDLARARVALAGLKRCGPRPRLQEVAHA